MLALSALRVHAHALEQRLGAHDGGVNPRPERRHKHMICPVYVLRHHPIDAILIPKSSIAR
jgi:hypothetical protein